MIKSFLGVFLALASFHVVFAQEADPLPAERDTTYINPNLSLVNDRIELFTEMSDLNPKKSAFLSAVLPGMGQVYNRQYWKLPLIIGGGLIIGHYIKYQDRLYNSFRSAFIANNDQDPNNNATGVLSGVSQEILERNADQLRRNRDYLMIIGGLFYLLQIADANISAHLHEFQVNDELSMNISPSIQPSGLISRSVGLSISLNFK